MSVTQVGTPNAATVSTTNGSNTVTNTWSGTQPRTAGDTLVMAVQASSTGTITPVAPAGWFTAVGANNVNTSSNYTDVYFYYKVATGGDAAPSCTITTAGTTRIRCTLIELTGADPVSPVDVVGFYGSGGSTGTIASMAVTTVGNVSASGGYALAAFAREQSSSATCTYTKGASWTNLSNDGSTNTQCHSALDYYASPPSGSTLSDSATITSATAYYSGAVVVFRAALGGPFGVVQADVSAGGATSITFDKATGTGNCLIVYVSSNSATAPTVTSGAYTLAQAVWTAGHSGDYTGIFYLNNCPSGLTSASASGVYTLGYAEISGIGAVPTVLTSTGGNASASATYSCTNPAASTNYFTIGILAYPTDNYGNILGIDGWSGQQPCSFYAQVGWTSLSAGLSGTFRGAQTSAYDVCAASFSLYSTVATPTVLTTTTTFTAPGIRADEKVTPSALSTSASFTAPALHITEGVTPTALTTTTSFSAPTFTSNATVTTTALSTSASFPAPTVVVATNASVTPTALSTSASFSAPTFNSNSSVTTTALTTTTSFSAPTFTSNSSVTTTALTTTTSFSAPTFTSNATVTPTALVKAATFFGPSIRADQTLTTAVLSGTVSLPPPTITAGTGATVTTTVLATAVSFTGPAFSSNASVTPTSLATTSGFTTPAASTSSVLTPAALTTTASFPAPTITITTSASVTPTSLATSASFIVPNVITYTIVQQGAGGGGSATATISATTAGTCLIAVCTSNYIWGTATATDGTTTYTMSLATFSSGNGGDYTGIFFLPNCPAGLTSITVKNAYAVGYLEVKGISGSTTIVSGTNGSGRGTNGTTFSCGNPSSSTPGRFTVYGFSYDSSNSGTAYSDGMSGDHIMSDYGQFSYTAGGTSNASGTMSSGTYDSVAVSFYPLGTGTGTWGGIQFVGNRGAKAYTSASSCAISPNATVTAGDTLIVPVQCTGNWVAGIQDTQGNIYHVDFESGPTGVHQVIARGYIQHALSTSDVITVTMSASDTGVVQLLEFANVSRVAPCDYPSQGDVWGQPATTVTNINEGGTTSPNELILATVGTAAPATGTVTWTAPAGWIEEPTGLSPGNTIDTAWTVELCGTNSKIGPTWTQGSSYYMSAIQCAYRPAQNVPFSYSMPAGAGVFRGACGGRLQDSDTSTGSQTGVIEYEQWLGHPISYPMDYVIDTPTTWAQFTGGLLGDDNPGTYTNLNQWGALPSRWTMVLSLPACCGKTAGSGASTWAGEAAGTNDAYWTALGNNLISWGYGNAIIRLGREWNGDWYNWAPGVTGDSIANYVAGWQHIVTLLRGLTGANFTFMWNPIQGGVTNSTYTVPSTHTLDWYPGDAYVDSIGIDFYDYYGPYTEETTPPWGGRTLEQQENYFSTQESLTNGTTEFISFAAQHGKPMAYPEWGLELWLQGSDYYGGGNDPFFIGQMSDLCGGSFMQAMWEDTGMGLFDTDACSRRTPNMESIDSSRALYLSLFGMPVPSSSFSTSFPASAPNTGSTITTTVLTTTTSFTTPTVNISKAAVTTALQTAAVFAGPTIRADEKLTTAVLAGTVSLPPPTLHTGSTITPTAPTTSTSFNAPTLHTGESPTTSVLATTTSFPAPVVTTTDSASVSTVALATGTTFPAPTPNAGSGVTPTALATATTFPASVPHAGSGVTPTTLSTTTTFPSCTANAGAGVTPPLLGSTTAFTAPALSTGTVVTPPAFSVSTGFSGPSLHAGETVTTTALATSTSFPGPTGLNSAVQPAALATTASFPAPTITSSVNTTITPTTLTTGTTFPASTPSVGKTITTVLLSSTTAFSAPVVNAGSGVTPSTLSTSTGFSAPSLHTSETVIPASLSGSVSFTLPTLHDGESITPSPLAGSVSFTSPNLSTGEVATATALSTTTSFGATVQAGSGTTVTPSTLARTTSFPAPTILTSTNATATPSALSSGTNFSAPVIAAGSGAHPAVLATSTTFPAATVSNTSGIFVTPATLATAASFPALVVNCSATVTGLVATEVTAGLSGSISTSRQGPAASISSAALAGSVATGSSISGLVAATTAQALAGSVSGAADVQGPVATSTATALPGEILAGAGAVGSTAQASVTAPAGTVSISHAVAGPVATLSVTALPGGTIVAAEGIAAEVMAKAIEGYVWPFAPRTINVSSSLQNQPGATLVTQGPQATLQPPGVRVTLRSKNSRQ